MTFETDRQQMGGLVASFMADCTKEAEERGFNEGVKYALKLIKEAKGTTFHASNNSGDVVQGKDVTVYKNIDMNKGLTNLEKELIKFIAEMQKKDNANG